MIQDPEQIIDAVSIDCLVFGMEKASLDILLVKHGEGISKGKWALPGGWIKYNESVDDAAGRILTALTGISNIYLEQIKAFGRVDRFPDRRVITVAYFALVNARKYKPEPGFTASEAKWFNVHKVPGLLYDHNEIFEFGFEFLKHKVQHEPIGFNLLPKKFTLLQLQNLYEALLDRKLDKPNFRRKLMNMKLLVPCEEKQKDVAHRAASLYRFDKKVYDELIKEGLDFRI
ncbi:MAG: NUDIX hydrolase [Bacteroidota bacterium]